MVVAPPPTTERGEVVQAAVAATLRTSSTSACRCQARYHARTGWRPGGGGEPVLVVCAGPGTASSGTSGRPSPRCRRAAAVEPSHEILGPPVQRAGQPGRIHVEVADLGARVPGIGTTGHGQGHRPPQHLPSSARATHTRTQAGWRACREIGSVIGDVQAYPAGAHGLQTLDHAVPRRHTAAVGRRAGPSSDRGETRTTSPHDAMTGPYAYGPSGSGLVGVVGVGRVLRHGLCSSAAARPGSSAAST